jgi:hypothetical protein
MGAIVAAQLAITPRADKKRATAMLPQPIARIRR